MSKRNTNSYRIIKFDPPIPNIRRPPRHRFRIRYFILVIAVVLLSCCQPSGASAISAVSCADIEFIFARGSGESLNSDTYRAWKNSIVDELSREIGDWPITRRFYELGSKPQNGFRYQAVRVSGDLEGIINLGGAAISGGEAYRFGESVANGAAELKVYMRQVSSACPQTKFILGGYSQGAMVLTRSLPDLDPNKIIYVATFGDPKLYLPEGSSAQGDDFHVPEACYGRSLSEYRAYVPDCYAYAGILGAAIPYQPLGYSSKLGSWCNQHDIMCSSGASIQDHTSYVSQQLYSDAAQKIVRAIKSAFIDRLDYDYEVDQHIHELAIVADISGSMARGDLYWSLTSKAMKIAKKVIDSGGRVSYFVYRDLIDGTETKRLCDFTCTLEELDEASQSVKLRNGEDDDESALSAMDYAINHLNWTENSEKSLLILTDAGLHDPDRDGTTSADVVASSQSHGGVKIFAPVWDKYAEEYRTIAEQTGGKVLRLAEGIEKASAAILPSPVVKLTQTDYDGPIGSRFVFDASNSEVFVGSGLVYDWDLDDNGIYELLDAGPVVEGDYAQFEGNIHVRVTDRAGNKSYASAHVKTQGSLSPIVPTKITGVDCSSSDKTRTSGSTAVIDFDTDAEQMLLIMDEAVLGFVEVNDGRGQIIIEDVAPGAQVVLVPYSSSGRRGDSHVISLGDNHHDDSNNTGDSDGTDKTPTSSPSASDPSTPRPSTPNQPSVTTTPASGHSPTYSSTQSATIPKAPNTGVRRTNSKEVDMLQP